MADPGPFYQRLAEEYDRRIRELVPRYDEMLEAVVDVLRAEAPTSVLEVGCGVGGLAETLLRGLGGVRLTALDASAAMAERAARRLEPFGPRASVVCADARSFVPVEPVDAVVSTLVLHNLPPEVRDPLVGRVAGWLGPGGVFVWAEFLRMADPRRQEETVAYRRAFTAASACPPDLAEWNYRKEAAEDHPPTAAGVLEVGKGHFSTADLVWAHDAFGVFAFRRGPAPPSQPTGLPAT